MQLPRSATVADRLEILSECPSTNTELVSRVAAGVELGSPDYWPDFGVLVTDNQTNGRGRLGRSWIAPPKQTLAISVVLRPTLRSGEPLELRHYGWFPLIAGLAMTRAVAPLVPAHSVTLKWPNDVLVDGRKVAGLLAELLAGHSAVVMGAGLNLAIASEQLPTPTSTSLGLNDAIANGDELADLALAAYLTEFRLLYTEFLKSDADAAASGIVARLTEHCSTLGQPVRVLLPGGDEITGTAVSIDSTGRLCVKKTSDGEVQAVAAGDVTHLRYE